MRRSIAAGVDTIEHGYGGTKEIFRAMKDRGIVLCPTLAANDAVARYQGWDGREPAPPVVEVGRSGFKAARAAGVIICAGGDVYASSSSCRMQECRRARC
jgi:imidazolonepropionase-like amidohydrolase